MYEYRYIVVKTVINKLSNNGINEKIYSEKMYFTSVKFITSIGVDLINWFNGIRKIITYLFIWENIK